VQPGQDSLLRPVVASRSSAKAVIVVQAQHASSAHHHEPSNKIRTIPGPAVRSLWRSELFSLVKLHLSRVPPADEEPFGQLLTQEVGLLLEARKRARPAAIRGGEERDGGPCGPLRERCRCRHSHRARGPHQPPRSDRKQSQHARNIAKRNNQPIVGTRDRRAPLTMKRQIGPCQRSHVRPSHPTERVPAVTRAPNSTAGRPMWMRRTRRPTRAPAVLSVRLSRPAKRAGAGRSPRRRRSPFQVTQSRVTVEAARSTATRTRRADATPDSRAAPSAPAAPKTLLPRPAWTQRTRRPGADRVNGSSGARTAGSSTRTSDACVSRFGAVAPRSADRPPVFPPSRSEPRPCRDASRRPHR
jgi:hypothetical protein